MKKLVSILLATMLVLSCLAGITFAADAEAKWTDGTTTKEGTVAEMVKEVNAKGGTLTLLKDYSHTDDKAGYAMAFTKSATIDLNGHTLSSVTRGIWFQTGCTGDAVIKNGTINSKLLNAYCEGGSMTMENVVGWSDSAQNIGYTTTSGAYNDKNVISGCTFANPAWGAIAFNNTKASMTAVSVTVKNTTLANVGPKTSGTVAVFQKAAAGGTIKLGEGNKFYSLVKKSGTPLQDGFTLTGETLTLSGTESFKILDKSYEGLTLWTTPATATAAPKEETPAETGAQVEYTAGGVTKEGTMAEAVKALNAAKGGTIKLLKDYSHTDDKNGYAVVIDVPFVFDLNGHVLRSVTRGIWGTGKTVTGVSALVDSVGTGYMDCKMLCFCTEKGGIYMNGVKCFSSEQQTVAVNETTSDWNGKSLIENCTLVSTKWGAIAYNNTKASMENYDITVKNSTLVNATPTGGKAIVVQTKAVESAITLGEGVKLGVVKEGSIASFVDSKLTVNGERPAAADKFSVTVGDHVVNGLFCMTTKAPATAPTNVGQVADWAEQTSATPAKPVETEKPAETKPAETTKPATTTPAATGKIPSAKGQPDQPAMPQNEELISVGGATMEIATVGAAGGNMGIVIAIVAAVAVVAVVAIVVLKKKKK